MQGMKKKFFLGKSCKNLFFRWLTSTAGHWSTVGNIQLRSLLLVQHTLQCLTSATMYGHTVGHKILQLKCTHVKWIPIK